MKRKILGVEQTHHTQYKAIETLYIFDRPKKLRANDPWKCRIDACHKQATIICDKCSWAYCTEHSTTHEHIRQESEKP